MATQRALSRPAVRVLDPSFNKYRLPLASVERLYTGCRWSEGPVYFGDGRYLLWSDIPNNRMLRWDEETGRVTVFRKPSNNANGHTRDRHGRLVACEHDARRVVRTEYDGAITVLADSYNGKQLNSPNDVVVKSDGSVWFTDPTFGILGYYEGHKAESENKPAVYRLDAADRQAHHDGRRRRRPQRPRLLARREEALRRGLARRAAPHDRRPTTSSADGTKLGNGTVLIDAGPGGSPDGFRVDVDGNLWCGWGMGSAELDGVRIFNPAGKPIGHIDLPERCANLCFGGRYRNRLFMAASHSLYALYVNTQGAPAADRKMSRHRFELRLVAAGRQRGPQHAGRHRHVGPGGGLARRAGRFRRQPRRHLLRLHHEHAGLLRRRRPGRPAGRPARHRRHLDPERPRPGGGLCAGAARPLADAVRRRPGR